MNSNFKNDLKATWSMDDSSATKIASVVEKCVNSNNDSTEKSKLTAAAKLAEKYENMPADLALAIVNEVMASEESPVEDKEPEEIQTPETFTDDAATSESADLDGLFDGTNV